MSMFDQFNGAKVLITGHTGFKGAWLSAWLKKLGAEVVGISLEELDNLSHFNVSNIDIGMRDYRLDIRNQKALNEIVQSEEPDFVFHLAAQALVRQSYDDPVATWSTNVIGTLNLLESLRLLKKSCYAVMITSDKCYDNVEWVWGYKETDALGGPDPYSASKGAAELVIRSHIKSFFPKEGKIKIASARAGNVVGGGDWSQDRIIPDCVKAWSEGETVKLRKPHATRPWQHVLEPLSGYLRLAIELSSEKSPHGEAFNFGPPAKQNQSVLELVEAMSLHWDRVKWEDISGIDNGPYESGLLKLNCDKALALLNWNAVMGFEDTVRMTAKWYSDFYKNPATISNTTNSQLEEYISLALLGGLDWAR
jgi:CDP-glucose 4,6-dehydratase